MEWVETTARTIEEAKDLALDELGVTADEADFEIVEEPRPGLFGRIRGEARVRARVRPEPARPKQERRRGRRGAERPTSPLATAESAETIGDDEESAAPGARRRSPRPAGRRRGGLTPSTEPAGEPGAPPTTPAAQGAAMSDDEHPTDGDDAVGTDLTDPVPVDDVRDAATAFMSGLTDAFGFDATVSATTQDNEIELRVDGTGLGLLVGPGGRTLASIQDLARVAAQRRLGDHETRLRVDVAGYREKRRLALERFAADVSEQVRTSGAARALDPMPSADRKVLHDAVAALDGVTSRSEGEEPNRRVVVVPT